jgi:hypothetical protein
MKTNFKFLLIVLLQLIMINGCEKNTNQVAIAQTDVLMPLAVGNTWIYKHTLLDSNNQVEFDGYDTLKVLKDSIINGNTFFGCSNGRFYRNTSWGLEMYYSFYNTNIIQHLQFPTAVNNSWVNFSADYPDSTSGNNDSLRVKYTTHNIDTLINVPKGNFNCIRYKQSLDGKNGTPFTMFYEAILEPVDAYYTKNIGVVKIVYMIQPNNYRQKFIFELVDYTLF